MESINENSSELKMVKFLSSQYDFFLRKLGLRDTIHIKQYNPYLKDEDDNGNPQIDFVSISAVIVKSKILKSVYYPDKLFLNMSDRNCCVFNSDIIDKGILATLNVLLFSDFITEDKNSFLYNLEKEEVKSLSSAQKNEYLENNQEFNNILKEFLIDQDESEKNYNYFGFTTDINKNNVYDNPNEITTFSLLEIDGIHEKPLIAVCNCKEDFLYCACEEIKRRIEDKEIYDVSVLVFGEY